MRNLKEELRSVSSNPIKIVNNTTNTTTTTTTVEGIEDLVKSIIYQIFNSKKEASNSDLDKVEDFKTEMSPIEPPPGSLKPIVETEKRRTNRISPPTNNDRRILTWLQSEYAKDPNKTFTTEDIIQLGIIPGYNKVNIGRAVSRLNRDKPVIEKTTKDFIRHYRAIAQVSEPPEVNTVN